MCEDTTGGIDDRLRGDTGPGGLDSLGSIRLHEYRFADDETILPARNKSGFHRCELPKRETNPRLELVLCDFSRPDPEPPSILLLLLR